MKIKQALSAFSLKTKVGVAVAAVALGFLSWSVASHFWAGDDKPPKKGSQTASADAQEQAKSDDHQERQPSGGQSQADDNSPMARSGNSSLVNKLGQSQGSQIAGQSTAGDSASERYPGTTEAPGQFTMPETAGLGNEYLQAGQGNLTTGDSTPGGAIANPQGTAFNRGYGESLFETTNRDATDSGVAFSQPTQGSREFEFGVTTPGYAAGTQTQRLDRSTPRLREGEPETSRSTTAGDPWQANGLRRQEPRGWGNDADTAASQFENPPRNNTTLNPTTADSSVLYPREQAIQEHAPTVQAGGNRRMTRIDSAASDQASTQFAANDGSAAMARQNSTAAQPDNLALANRALEPIAKQADKAAAQQFIAAADDSFWTIARKAYDGQGGYFEALHAYNRQRIARIDGLMVGDTIDAPPPEVLRQLFPLLCPPEKPRNAQGHRNGGLDTTAAELQSNAASAPTERQTDTDQAMTGVRTASHEEPIEARPTVQHNLTRVYLTVEGDDVFRIARDQLGNAIHWEDVYDLNRDILGAKLENLPAGMQLRLPKVQR